MTPNSEIHQKHRSLLCTLSSPLGPDTLSRIRNKLAEVDELPQAFIAVYSPATRTCFTITVAHGEVVGWTAFGAKDEESALQGARALHGVAESMLSPVVQGAADDAVRLIENAARRP